GLLPEVALRSEGTPNTFSYRHGETARLQDGLTAIGPKQVRVLDAEGRPRVVEADFGGKRPNLYFVERAPEAPPETKPPTGPAEPPVPPAEQNWLRLEAAKEALERRRIPWSRVPKDLRDLETARPRAQTKPETIEETARRLAELEAWLGKQTDTPWQTGREARIQVTADTAQAHVARLPRGPLREYLENNRG